MIFLPENPERDGPHWFKTPWGALVIRHWYAGPDTWSDDLEEVYHEGWRYIGHCWTPEEVERALAIAGSLVPA